jgi:hypothetical protein
VIEFENVKSVITPDTECETKTCKSLFEEIRRKKTETFIVKEKEKLVLDKK